ncbi:MAG: glycosyltransferase family 2 protein [Enterobacterales bacterium]|nr:glycosyltransferase family 2 protein [Enterobacterales bacterium]
MKKTAISVFIITLNEQKNIARAIESAQFCDEIIVVDCGSTDKTLEIVQSYGITPIHNDWPGYSKQKQFAMEQCKNDWVFNLDADEEISLPLAEKITAIIKQEQYTSIRCARKDVFISKPPPNWTKKANNLRCYRKSMAQFDPKQLVHESASVKGKEIYIKQFLIHYGYDDIHRLIDKKNSYSSLKAKEKHHRKKTYSLAKLLLIFPIVFIQQWIFNRKIFFGIRGIILSIIQAHYAFIKEAKLYELEENNRYNIEKE